MFYQFKNQYGLEANDINYYIAIACIPYAFKIVFGIMFDTIRIGKSKYKNWIYIYSLIQILSALFLFLFEIPKKYLMVYVVMVGLNWLAVSALDLLSAIMMIH